MLQKPSSMRLINYGYKSHNNIQILKIAIFGYGKMGKLIERLAIENFHQVVYIQDINFKRGSLDQADVAIVFSSPNAAVENIELAFKHKLNVVCGTTGWLNQYEKVVDLSESYERGFLYASNFSLGVNILFELNRQLAKLIKPLGSYTIFIHETHHTEKLDKPSGTAITLAEDLLEILDYKNWTLEVPKKGELKINALRKPDVVGTHRITYKSDIDQLSIQHKALKRDGFALGALTAANWIKNKVGVFSMSDIFSINQDN